MLAVGIYDDNAVIDVQTQSNSISAPEGFELRSIKISAREYAADLPTELRFLIPDGRGTLSLMQYINGAWKAVDFTENGRYIVLSSPLVENGCAAFCIGRTPADWVPVLIIAVIAILIITNIILWTILIKRRRAARRKSEQEKKTPENV